MLSFPFPSDLFFLYKFSSTSECYENMASSSCEGYISLDTWEDILCSSIKLVLSSDTEDSKSWRS